LLTGKRAYKESYQYAGDFKDGFACVRLNSGSYIHIDGRGIPRNGKEFCDLGVFHKGYATAKDEKGWFHIDDKGDELYSSRFASAEPFYNGLALVESFSGFKQIIDETGMVVLKM
jgi:hypothetical protein